MNSEQLENMELIQEITRRIKGSLENITDRQQKILDCEANGLVHIKAGLFQDVTEIVTMTIIQYYEDEGLTNTQFADMFNSFSHTHYDLFSEFVKNHCKREEILGQL